MRRSMMAAALALGGVVVGLAWYARGMVAPVAMPEPATVAPAPAAAPLAAGQEPTAGAAAAAALPASTAASAHPVSAAPEGDPISDVTVVSRDLKPQEALVESGLTRPMVRAAVAAVRNNPQGQQDLVMLAVDKKDQVKVGDEFIVFRGTQYVVKVRVEELINDMVAGRVISESWNTNGLQVQAGDLAQNRL